MGNNNFVRVATEKLVYVVIDGEDEFNRIWIEAKRIDEKLTVKTIEQDGVVVVFQYHQKG